MKILVIGGTGAFGARLCGLLARDGHRVSIASRSGPDSLKPSERPEAFANGGSFTYQRFERGGALEGLSAFDLIVDAAGPFHVYGDDPYRIARAAIAAGAHYFDLSDNADFCQGINVLDADAKAAGVSVYSGMSSVPAVSSAAVQALAGSDEVLSIDSAILPGNKAPRGRSVIESILHQTGTTYEAVEGGFPVAVRSWSDPITYDLGAGLKRQGWRIEVPDQRLFPDHFNCPTVTFRAGLELGVMRYGLGVFSRVRSVLGFGIKDWFVSCVMFAAKGLAAFGSNAGGMAVYVVCRNAGLLTRRSWRLRATSGDGPFVPGIAVRAACRDIDRLKPGAGAALSLIPLAALEAAFEDLSITTSRSSAVVLPLFPDVLGADFDHLPKAVRDTHTAATPRRFLGRARVQRGAGIQARVAAFLFGFPATQDDIEVEVIKRPAPEGEVWHRRFGARRFRSTLHKGPTGMRERFGLLTFDLDLKATPKGLQFPVASGRVLFLPIPKALLPQSEAIETEVEGRFHFDVHLKAPTGATLVHYRGWLEQQS